MRLKIELFIATAFIIGLFQGCEEAKEEISSRDLLGKCKELRIGMTYKNVVEKMGQPINTTEIERDGRIKQRLYFPSPRAASTFLQCVIDKDSLLVEEVICGEDYRLKK